MSDLLHFEPGEIVIAEGATGEGFYVLKSGHLEVFKGNVLVAQYSKPETIFGEMSDILGKPRTCKVVTKTEAEILHVRQGIREIVRANPDLTIKLLYHLADRLEETTERLANPEVNLVWCFEEPLANEVSD